MIFYPFYKQIIWPFKQKFSLLTLLDVSLVVGSGVSFLMPPCKEYFYMY